MRQPALAKSSIVACSRLPLGIPSFSFPPLTAGPREAGGFPYLPHPQQHGVLVSEREQKSHRPGRREVHDRGTVWAARRVSSWSFLRRVSSRRMFWVHGCKRMACWSDSIRVMVLPPTLRVQMW